MIIVYEWGDLIVAVIISLCYIIVDFSELRYFSVLVFLLCLKDA